MSSNPPPAREIRNSRPIAHKIARPVLLQLPIHNPVQPPRLVLVPIDAILDLLRRVPSEVVSLPLHGTQTAHLPEQPALGLVVLLAALRVRDLLILVVAFDQVLHDGSRLEQGDGRAVLELVGQSGNAAVGVDFKEPGLFLDVFGDVDCGYLGGVLVRFEKRDEERVKRE